MKTGTMTVMPLAAPPRRPTTLAMLVVAGLCLALVGAALWNPWRLTALHPLASTGGAVAALTLAGALVAGAVLLALADTARRALAGLVVALIAVPAVGVGLPVLALGGVLRDRLVVTERVLATSPDGQHSAVAVTGRDGTTDVLIRTRAGLLSREAADPVASCPHDPFATELPPESVRFTAQNRVAVPMLGDGVSVTVGFDRATLVPERTVAMCG
jgi:hypothetical protein